LSWDQIPLSWGNYLRFLLEMVNITFAIGPLLVFLQTNSLSTTIVATLVLVFLFVISLVVMRIVEKEMYEVLKGMRKGKMWLNLR
jgi:nitrogen fixation/metabolism regulation signal transduction histidine kinase